VSGIVLQSGANVLTVTARDAAGNTSTDTLTVTYTPSRHDQPDGVDHDADGQSDPQRDRNAAGDRGDGLGQRRRDAGDLGQ
jgi:hypothetical protein